MRVFLQQSGGAFRLAALKSTLGDADRSLAFAKLFRAWKLRVSGVLFSPFATFSR